MLRCTSALVFAAYVKVRLIPHASCALPAALFTQVDACVEPVLSLGEALDDSQILARQMVIECEAPRGGRAKQVAMPIKFSESKPSYRPATVAKGIGCHTEEALEALGYADDEVDQFHKTGVFN